MLNLFATFGANAFDPRLLIQHKNPKALENWKLSQRIPRLFKLSEKPLAGREVDNPNNISRFELIVLTPALKVALTPASEVALSSAHEIALSPAKIKFDLSVERTNQPKDLMDELRKELSKLWNSGRACHACLRKCDPRFVHRGMKLCYKCEHDFFEEGSGQVFKLGGLPGQPSNRKQTKLFRCTFWQ